jgi:glycosidase
MLFGDNHDMDRIFTQVGESPELLEMALAYLLVAPRIPQIYYGTEIQMQNSAKPGDHGLIRTDFPGGWEGSPKNAFTGEGLSESQIKTQEILKTLLNFRKDCEAIQRGKTLHFAPENGVYVLTRILGDQKVVLILNKNDESVKLNLARFSELGLQGKTVKDIIRGDSFKWDDTIELNHKGAYILTTSF